MFRCLYSHTQIPAVRKLRHISGLELLPRIQHGLLACPEKSFKFRRCEQQCAESNQSACATLQNYFYAKDKMHTNIQIQQRLHVLES